jgi:hypothetical protein
VTKLILSALFRKRREEFQAQVAEFPDIKVSARSVGAALVRLREAIWHRLRWTKVETSCSGEPISPVPQKPSPKDLVVPIEVEVPTDSPVVAPNEERAA